MTAPSSQALWYLQATLVWMRHCQDPLAQCKAWWDPHTVEFWSLQSPADPPAARNHCLAWDDLRGDCKGLWRFAADCRALCGRAGCALRRLLSHRYCPQSSIWLQHFLALFSLFSTPLEHALWPSSILKAKLTPMAVFTALGASGDFSFFSWMTEMLLSVDCSWWSFDCFNQKVLPEWKMLHCFRNTPGHPPYQHCWHIFKSGFQTLVTLLRRWNTQGMPCVIKFHHGFHTE